MPVGPHENVGVAPDPDRFYESTYAAALRALIGEILRQESPVREELLVRAVARRHGWQRAGRRIREHVLRCLPEVEIHEEDGVRFY
ncbi:MAG: DUF3320 domain-containing protein, partial [Pseudomonadota bacterium]